MIGIFDSGIGGLTVVRELERQAPDVPFVYLGDTARTPYGNKSAETVVRYALEDAAFLVAQGAEAIIIACNSASAVATDALRAAHPDLPVFEVIAPAVEDALAATKGRIGVIGTRATIASGAYDRQLRASKKVDVESAPCPLFVPLVEEGWLEDAETKRIARRYLSPLRHAQVDTLILGCTHYPLLAPIIRRYMGNRVTLIDSATSVVRRVLEPRTKYEGRGTNRYFLTDLSSRSEDIARQWLGHPVTFEQATLSCHS
jgi:glutamate racemase